MNHDTVLRAAAVVAAVALLAAPYWRVIARQVAEAAKAAKPYTADASRFVAACLLIFAAVGVGHMPQSLEVTPAGIVTAAKVVVGIGLVGYAFSETARSFRVAFADRLEVKSP